LVAGKENTEGMTTDRVEIFSISTRIDVIDYLPEGSIKGGTVLFIRAIGHNMTPSKNKITIGPYDCVVPEKSISDDLITCVTTEGWDPLRRWSLDVELHVVGKVQSTCSTSNGRC
jgi:hypothetical protein